MAVSNVTYLNWNDIPVRAKLLKPVEVSAANPLPGIVYIHGCQNNRETSDAYCIELARRGFVVRNIDAIGRGNSGIIGRGDEYRKRMTGTQDIEKEWMGTFQTRRAIPEPNQKYGGQTAYGIIASSRSAC